MQSPITIGHTEIQPGRRTTIDLPVARLYTHTEMSIPVHVIHGKKAGPRLFVSAVIHGDEINGLEIIRRLLKLKLVSKISGTLILIPIVNVYGFINRSRYFPDRRDLNRFFPGSDQGSPASRLAKLFMEEIVEKCTHGIDLHTGSNHRVNLPQIRANMEDPETERLARSFRAPVIVDARLRDGSLREAVADKRIPMLLYEAGEAFRFNELAIKTGVRGIISVMREIGILKKSMSPKSAAEPLVVKTTKWIRAPKSGILHWGAPLGASVSNEQLIGRIGDPFGESEENVVSSISGVVIGRLGLPLVYAGDALFNIAVTDDSSTAVEALELLDIEPFDDQNFGNI